MGRSAAAVIVTTTVLACFSGTSLIAQDAAKTDEKPGPKRIELTEPGVYTESDCTYVMTRDVTAKGCGFTFEGKNVVVDLGGHTLTFNTEPYRPTFPPKASPATRGMWTPPFGICFKRDSENVELRNGTIIQGAGRDKDVRGVFIRAKRANIHHTTTVISDDHGSNFLAWWAGSDVELHHNYIVNNAVAESGWSKGVNLQEAGTHWNIHHNTIVGGHQGILVNGRREKEGVHIHHNWIQHKRTPGQKVPQAMRIRASGCAIDHNEIVSIDGRGIQPVRPNNHWHHNVVDVRYTLKAKGGF